MSKKRSPLTAKQIITRAMEILDQQGEAGLSMRQLAADFGVDPMAIYYHIPNKESLIDGVINAVIGELELPGARDWQTQLRLLCHALRQVARNHPKIYVIYSSYHKVIRADFLIGEAFLKVFQLANLPPQDTIHALMTVMTYVCGFALEEATGRRPYANYLDFEAIAHLTKDEFPTVHSYLETAKDVDMDAEFEFGLDLMIAGIRQSTGS
ncbi:MAG: TetR/AcrR family transcriptional regulator [Pseudanabaenaceae cyanobacterium bins.68]|nr:TetR/AcrR family transcriptional regulator [Pseudanabaenaceae cyanobacterium bins.68]